MIGVGETTAYAALTWAYSRTDLTSVIAVLSGAFSLPTIILARLFLRERMSGLQTMGAVAVLCGTMFLAVA
jgi:drug/metabolite transporter (DMT)-like permease